MDKNETARKIRKLFDRKARLTAKMADVDAEICKALCDVARSEEAGLEPDVVAFSVAPKEED